MASSFHQRSRRVQAVILPTCADADGGGEDGEHPDAAGGGAAVDAVSAGHLHQDAGEDPELVGPVRSQGHQDIGLPTSHRKDTCPFGSRSRGRECLVTFVKCSVFCNSVVLGTIV